MIADQTHKALEFRALHAPGKPLVLFNVWDAGSAKAVTAAGATAIATSSWSVAAAHGFSDGEQMPLALAIANLHRIVTATALPVTVDLESGYGEAIAETIELAIAAGAIGCNLEDSSPTTGKLRETAAQCECLRRARQTAEAAKIAFFINARTDVFFERPAAEHDEAIVRDAIMRANAYAEAGADGIFVPGLTNLALIARFAKSSPLPVNIMVGDGTPPASALAEAGVARISYGPGPYLLAMKALERAARLKSPELPA
jgi:2-methylisocitrate lyase-like PEP mutase family enzyme